MQIDPMSVRVHLKRIGTTLVLIGALDIAYMVYCITQHWNYSSSLNIFAVIAGVYLLRGNLRAANIIAWFAAFEAAGAIAGIVILAPLYLPLGLLITSIKINPMQGILRVVIGILLIAYLIWIHLQLRVPSVLQAQDAVGIKNRKPWTAVLAAVTLVVVIAVLMQGFLHGDMANRAIEHASRIDGPSFKYVVTSISVSNGHVLATVTAYNNVEIKTERVEFQE